MARSKPSSPRARPTRVFAFLRPHVRASIPPPASTFQLPLRMEVDNEVDFPQERQDRLFNEHSTGSLATSRSTTEPSNSSARLDGERRLSVVLTPTASEGTGSENGASTTHATSNIATFRGRGIRRYRPRTQERVTASIDETLLGQGRWIPTQLESVQDVEFVSGHPPDELAPTQSQSPWSGLSRSERSPAESASPTERRGGRRGGFAKEKAVKVGEMRQKKACLRCLFYRIECDGGDPCAQCGRRMRTWNLPCTRERLPERLGLLLPIALIAHLRFDKVQDFMGANAERYRSGPKEAFHLPLTQFLDEGDQKYLWVQVREFEPLGSRLLRRPGFLEVDGVVKEVQRHSPPVMPYIAEWKETEKQVSETLQLWLLRFFEGDDSDWQQYVFPRKKEQMWERNILGQICHLLDPGKVEHEHLEVAIELTFFTHLFTHSFAVPDEHIEWLYNLKLQHPDYKGQRPQDGQEVCPHAVNRFLAMIVLQKVEGQASRTLEHINKLFASRDDSLLTGVLAFCESFLFLMTLAQLQRSVLERSKVKSDVYETTLETNDAKELIEKMENELATPIIELCVFKLRKVSKKRKAKEAGQSSDHPEAEADESVSQFCNNLHKITDLYEQEAGYVLGGRTELENIDELTFGATNVQRLMRRLYVAATPFFPPAGPSEVMLR